MRFHVRAYGGGQITSVVIEALSPEDAWRQVSAQSLQPMAVRTLGKAGWQGRIGTAERFPIGLFSQEMLALLEAGLSIIETIDILAERERAPGARHVLDQLALKLREGKSLAGALEAIPEAFPALFVGIVRSAERTGNLQDALGRFIDYRARIDALRGKLINATIYPLLLVIVAVGVTLFLGGYVIPRFAAVYEGTGRSLPWASGLLLRWGGFASQHWPILVAGLLATGVASVFAVRSLARGGGFAAMLRRIPVLAERIRTYEMSRLYLTLGMLLDSGLPILKALPLAEASLLPYLRAALQASGEYIRVGEKLSTAFERTGLTTGVASRMIRVGEESGRLGEMMTRAARFHDEETGRWIERFSRIAEPTLMVGIGLIIGTIVVLLYLPIFDLAGSLR